MACVGLYSTFLSVCVRRIWVPRYKVLKCKGLVMFWHDLMLWQRTMHITSYYINMPHNSFSFIVLEVFPAPRKHNERKSLTLNTLPLHTKTAKLYPEWRPKDEWQIVFCHCPLNLCQSRSLAVFRVPPTTLPPTLPVVRGPGRFLWRALSSPSSAWLCGNFHYPRLYPLTCAITSLVLVCWIISTSWG